LDTPIRFCTTSDGVRIAYTVDGDGLPLVKVMGYVTNVELDRGPAAFPAADIGAIPGFRLIRYDKRGTGLSDRGISDFSVDNRVRDLEALVDALSLKRFYLLGISEGGPIAIMYTARYPKRVIKLGLYGTSAYAGGGSPGTRALAELTRADWGVASDAMSGLFVPGATAEERRYVARYQRASATNEEAAAMIEAAQVADVRDLLPNIKTPTVVIHARGDHVMPFEGGREIAGAIPGARLVPLETDRHAPTPEGRDEINDRIKDFFLGDRRRDAAARVRGSTFKTVLFTDLVGHTEMMQRLGDDRGREVLRAHERVTRELLKKYGGAEVKTMGDGFMASFGSVTKAMDCAIALQRAFERQPGTNQLEAEGENVRVRVGLDAGEPIEEDGDLFGSTVIMASRICAQAGAGEILIPEPLRHLLTGKSYVYGDRGETVLKGFEDAVRLYEVRWQQ
jgi:class 3 adenylate cyclase